jgi:molecular chaperone GrpE
MSKKVENEPNDSKKDQENMGNSPSPESKETKQKEKESTAGPKLEKDKQIEQLNEKINSLEKEIKILKEKNLRSLADLNNQVKIHAKETSEIIRYSNERLLSQLLFFPDNYERALQISQNDPDPKIQNFLTGFQMVLTEFQNFLKKQGVEEIKITPKKDIYNSELHDALGEPEENNDYPEETILQVFRKGYQIHQRVLRKATVKVSKRKEIKEQKKE